MNLTIMIMVTHLLGAGHLTRAAALAAACHARGHRVVLISGGMPHGLMQSGSYEAMQLPPVKIEGTAFTKLLTPQGNVADAEYLAKRKDTARIAIEQFQPDVLVTELFPFGRRVLADEFLATIDAVRAQPKPVTILASIRDILATTRTERIIETEQRLDVHYDGVLVHGDPAFVPLDASWPVSSRLGGKLHYTGYIDNPAASEPSDFTTDIIVSGGSSAASLPLYRAAIAAAGLIPHSWRILVGHGVGATDFAALAASAPANASVERARSDFRAVLMGARVSISQCGYNTALDVLIPTLRRLFVPFEADHETEQLLRANALAQRGVADVLRERDLSTKSLAEAVDLLLERNALPIVPLDRDGAKKSALLIEALAEGSAHERYR